MYGAPLWTQDDTRNEGGLNWCWMFFPFSHSKKLVNANTPTMMQKSPFCLDKTSWWSVNWPAIYLTRGCVFIQRWANSVLMTEYEYYSVPQKLSNTNTNIIQFPKNDRLRKRILFGFSKMTEHKYEYYSVFQRWPNTNTNIFRLPRNDRIPTWIQI